MRFDRVVSKVRGRRSQVAVAAVLLLVLSGAVVALVGDTPAQKAATTVAERPLAAPDGFAAPGGGASASATASDASTNASEQRAATAGAPGAVADAGGGAAKGAPSLAVADKAGAKVIKTANLRVEVGKGGFRSAFDRAASVAARYNGYVASSSEATVDEKASEGTLTIRVPADQFDAARRDLAGLGNVEHQELGGQDVTAQLVDFDARIRSLQAQEQALSAILGRARSVGEVLEVQGQLFNVRQQIEQLQAERGNIDAQASMATITATVFEPGAAVTKTKPAPEPATGLARSWDRAWDAAIAVIGGMVIVTGVLVPIAVLALLGWVLWRLSMGRRRTPTATPAA
ncbi:MAG: hypothetical protein QOG87_4334 [Actinomycetota bacterium]|jgi:hypothetical protein